MNTAPQSYFHPSVHPSVTGMTSQVFSRINHIFSEGIKADPLNCLDHLDHRGHLYYLYLKRVSNGWRELDMFPAWLLLGLGWGVVDVNGGFFPGARQQTRPTARLGSATSEPCKVEIQYGVMVLQNGIFFWSKRQQIQAAQRVGSAALLQKKIPL